MKQLSADTMQDSIPCKTTHMHNQQTYDLSNYTATYNERWLKCNHLCNHFLSSTFRFKPREQYLKSLSFFFIGFSTDWDPFLPCQSSKLINLWVPTFYPKRPNVSYFLAMDRKIVNLMIFEPFKYYFSLETWFSIMLENAPKCHQIAPWSL